MKIFLIFISIVFCTFSYSQDLNYKETTSEAVLELEGYYNNNPEKINNKLNYIKQLEEEDKVILSSKQYEEFLEEYYSIKDKESLPYDQYSKLKYSLELRYNKYINIINVIESENE